MLASHMRQEDISRTSLKQVQAPTAAMSGQGSVSIKRELGVAMKNSAERNDESPHPLANENVTNDGGQKKRKSDIGVGLQDSETHSKDEHQLAQGKDALKRPKTATTGRDLNELRDEVIELDAYDETLPNKHQQQNTIIHFFLSDTKLGAIPLSLHECISLDTFFEEASKAWRELEHGASTPVLVSVKFDWKTIPMVIRWRNSKGFKKMLETIRTAPCWEDLNGYCSVEVRCALRKS